MGLDRVDRRFLLEPGVCGMDLFGPFFPCLLEEYFQGQATDGSQVGALLRPKPCSAVRRW